MRGERTKTREEKIYGREKDGVRVEHEKMPSHRSTHPCAWVRVPLSKRIDTLHRQTERVDRLAVLWL